MTAPAGNDEDTRWYVMRDLKRVNAKQPAYMELKGMGMEVFVPMKQHLKMKKGVRVREEVPFIPDLLFVHEARTNLDLAVEPLAAKHMARAYDCGRQGHGTFHQGRQFD